MERQRRAVVKGLAATPFTALTACGGSGSNSSPSTGDSDPGVVSGDSARVPRVAFNHGVASGDPLSDRVILWTRVTPTDALPRTVESVPVQVTVARDRDMREPIGQINTTTGADLDFCVKVDVTGLRPDTWYYYQFSVGNQKSVVGRTRTFPDTTMPAERARFAVVSCSNYAYGLFSVYKAVSEQAVQLANPHMKYVELKTPGFILVDVTTERTQAELLYVRSISSTDDLGTIDPNMIKVVGVDSGNSRIYQDRPRSEPRAVRTAMFHPPVRQTVS